MSDAGGGQCQPKITPMPRTPASYAVTPDDPACKVPNPAKKSAAAAVKNAMNDFAEPEAARQRKLDELRSPAPARKPSSPTPCTPSRTGQRQVTNEFLRDILPRADAADLYGRIQVA